MGTDAGDDEEIRGLLGRARAGDAGAREAVALWAWRRSKQLRRGFDPGEILGEETDDVSNKLYIDLKAYLDGDPSSRVPESPAALVALARRIMKNGFLDEMRKHQGQGGRRRERRGVDAIAPDHPMLRESSHNGRLRTAAQVRELIGRLPEAHREAVRIESEFVGDARAKIEAIREALGLADVGSAYRRRREALEAFGKLVEEDDRKGDGL